MARTWPPLLLVSLLLALPPGAVAQEHDAESSGQRWLSELRGGVLAHDVGFLWSNFSEEEGIAFSAEAIWSRAGLEVLWGTLRPNLGVTINDRGDTSKLYGGMVLEYRSSFGLFVDLFRTGFDLGYEITPHHRLMLSFDHISNAGLASPNQGLDTLGVRYGYRF
jgi:hypothetical protein